MRIFFTALALSLIGAAPAQAASRNFGVSGFDRIRVDGPYRVTLTVGVAPFATASADSAAALDSVSMDVQGRTLVIRGARASWGGYPGQATGPVDISIGTHELFAAWLNGSGSLAINKLRGLSFDLSVHGSGAAIVGAVEVDQFKVTISGSAGVRLAGSAPKLTANVLGVATLDASGLTSKNATIAAQGPATVRVTVTETAKVSAQGASSVELSGSPACAIKASGSANISGCR